MSDDVEIEVSPKATTPNAILIENLKGGDVWIARSLISDYSGDDDSPDTIFIPEWLAIREDLV